MVTAGRILIVNLFWGGEIEQILGAKTRETFSGLGGWIGYWDALGAWEMILEVS